MLERRDHRITDHIVDEISADRAGIAEIAHLERSAAVGEDAEPRIPGMALEVDRDVDLELMQELRRIVIAAHTHVMEGVERFHQPPADVAVIVPVKGHAYNLEARAIVQLEQFGNEISGGMAVEIRREIGHPNPLMACRRAAP